MKMKKKTPLCVSLDSDTLAHLVELNNVKYNGQLSIVTLIRMILKDRFNKDKE